jgi:hypothetical protein
MPFREVSFFDIVRERTLATQWIVQEKGRSVARRDGLLTKAVSDSLKNLRENRFPCPESGFLRS